MGLANATAVCTAYCGEGSGFLEDCVYDVCRAGPQVAISDCLIAWQTKVATTPAIPTAPSLVGAGCCRPVIVAILNRQHNLTRSQCAMDCASKPDCNAFAISGCSSSSEGTCGGACHHYLIDSQQEAQTGDCLESALNGNTLLHCTVSLSFFVLRAIVFWDPPAVPGVADHAQPLLEVRTPGLTGFSGDLTASSSLAAASQTRWSRSKCMQN